MACFTDMWKTLTDAVEGLEVKARSLPTWNAPDVLCLSTRCMQDTTSKALHMLKDILGCMPSLWRNSANLTTVYITRVTVE